MIPAEYTRAKFIEDVLLELSALRQHATMYEVAFLDIAKMRPDSKFDCIYGQMTGNCFGNRATELLFKCSSRFFWIAEENFVLKFEYLTSAIYQGDNLAKISGRHAGSFLSALEIYVLFDRASIQMAINYLKNGGELPQLDETILI